jgi:hypothetical protein
MKPQPFSINYEKLRLASDPRQNFDMLSQARLLRSGWVWGAKDLS